MRKLLAILIVVSALTVALPTGAQAQCGNLRHRHGNVTHSHRACVGDGHKHGRSFWQKHRDKLTTAGGAVGGAAIGGGARGEKRGGGGAARAGGGGGAVH